MLLVLDYYIAWSDLSSVPTSERPMQVLKAIGETRWRQSVSVTRDTEI